jgi:polysaccharide pyruvyl transferase WcaK-like protein
MVGSPRTGWMRDSRSSNRRVRFLLIIIMSPTTYGWVDAPVVRSNSETRASMSSISIALAEWLTMISAARTRVDGEEITKRLLDLTGLVVSGGGNQRTTWPEKILERAALLKHAQKSDIPTVILGQTLGPSLSPDQRRLLSGPLQRTEWLGVRDESSAALAL